MCVRAPLPLGGRRTQAGHLTVEEEEESEVSSSCLQLQASFSLVMSNFAFKHVVFM